MFVTKEVDYGLRTMMVLASMPEKGLVDKDLSNTYKIPFNFLTLILQKLVRANLLRIEQEEEEKKPRYLMNKPASSITILHIIEAINGPLELLVMNDEHQEDAKQFPQKMQMWTELTKDLEEFFSKRTLDQFLIE